jgi:hypothetical protein
MRRWVVRPEPNAHSRMALQPNFSAALNFQAAFPLLFVETRKAAPRIAIRAYCLSLNKYMIGTYRRLDVSK